MSDDSTANPAKGHDDAKVPRRWLRTIERAASPTAILDGQRRIVFLNSAAESWLGASLADVLGKRCDYESAGESMPARVAGALAPPPTVWNETGGAWVDGAVVSPATGATRRVAFTVLRDALGSPSACLIVIANVDSNSEPMAATSIDVFDLRVALARLRREDEAAHRVDRLIAVGPAMAHVREQIRAASASVAVRTVVIGPRGSGREFVARAIHNARPGAGEAALVPVHCRALDDESLQDVLRKFHRRFGAVRSESTPTLLLLDVDQAPESAQRELAGFTALPGFDVPMLATARRSLRSLARRKKYSPELAARLEALALRLPALSRRREDLPLLTQRFVEAHNSLGGTQLVGASPETIERLLAWRWPGDVEELKSVVTLACAKAKGPWLAPADLPERFAQAVAALAHPSRGFEPISLDENLAAHERDLLARALASARGNKSKAARSLGISRPRLLRRLGQLGLIAPEADDGIVFEEIASEPATDEKPSKKGAKP